MTTFSRWLQENDSEIEYLDTEFLYGPELGQAIPYPILRMSPETWIDLYYKTEIELIILDQIVREVKDAEVSTHRNRG